jgi:hypothetical protein
MNFRIRLLLYRIYGWIHSTFFMKMIVILAISCQICGEYHHERYCPNAREYGFLREGNHE